MMIWSDLYLDNMGLHGSEKPTVNPDPTLATPPLCVNPRCLTLEGIRGKLCFRSDHAAYHHHGRGKKVIFDRRWKVRTEDCRE